MTFALIVLAFAVGFMTLYAAYKVVMWSTNVTANLADSTSRSIAKELRSGEKAQARKTETF